MDDKVVLQQYFDEFQGSQTLTTGSEFSIKEDPLELYGLPDDFNLGNEATVDRKTHQVAKPAKLPRSPKLSQKEPDKRNILCFWLGKFKQDYLRRHQIEIIETQRCLHEFLTNPKLTKPRENEKKEMFEDYFFYKTIREWFDVWGETALRHSKVQEMWWEQYLDYLKEELRRFGEYHASLQSQYRESSEGAAISLSS